MRRNKVYNEKTRSLKKSIIRYIMKPTKTFKKTKRRNIAKQTKSRLMRREGKKYRSPTDTKNDTENISLKLRAFNLFFKKHSKS